MATTHRVYVGTIGEGIWRSVDGGETFTCAADGMFVECHVRALVVHPDKPGVLYLGSEQGLFRTTDGANSWQCLPAPCKVIRFGRSWFTRMIRSSSSSAPVRRISFGPRMAAGLGARGALP